MQGGGGYSDYGSGGGYNQVRGSSGWLRQLLLGLWKGNFNAQKSVLVLQRAGEQGHCTCSSLALPFNRHICSFSHRVAMVAAATVATVAATVVAVAVAEAPTATEAPPAPTQSMH